MINLIAGDVYFIKDNKRANYTFHSKYMFAILQSINNLKHSFFFYIPDGIGQLSITSDEIMNGEYQILEHVASFEEFYERNKQ